MFEPIKLTCIAGMCHFDCITSISACNSLVDLRLSLWMHSNALTSSSDSLHQGLKQTSDHLYAGAETH